MARYKIQSHRDLKQEMKAIARGERRSAADSAGMSFNSIDALTRLLTPENRKLMATIRDRRPQSISELSDLTGRDPGNLARTLAKLVSVGFLEMQQVDRRKIPVPKVRRVHVEIDPFSNNDKLDVA
jgi:predicted transcriptional regulator